MTWAKFVSSCEDKSQPRVYNAPAYKIVLLFSSVFTLEICQLQT